MGGPAYEALLKNMDLVRLYQSNEGMTLLDGADTFETHQYSFAGLDDVISQFAEQISGATGIPLVRLFGQSPKVSLQAMLTCRTITTPSARSRSADCVSRCASCST